MPASVTVVVSIRDCPHPILQTVDSAWRTVDEVVVVGDGSSSSCDVEGLCSDRPNLRHLALDRNSCVQIARNVGLDAACSESAIVLGDGDELIGANVAVATAVVQALENWREISGF